MGRLARPGASRGWQARIYTRKGKDWTTHFGSVVAALEQVPARNAILDGEAVVLDESGRPHFHALRRELGKRAERIIYKAFDLLWLDGEDLRPQPTSDRKASLERLLKRRRKPPSAISYVEPIYGDGARVLVDACRLSMEGIVSKRIDAPYRAGRSDA